MADLTLKKIEDVLDKKLDQKLKPIKKKLEVHDTQFKSINSKLDEHSQRLDSLILDMIDVQKKTDILPDLHSYIKDTKVQVDGYEERIQRLENST